MKRFLVLAVAFCIVPGWLVLTHEQGQGQAPAAKAPAADDPALLEKCSPFRRPLDFAEMCYEDLMNEVAPEDRPFVRYFWNEHCTEEGSAIEIAFHRFMMHLTISHSSSFFKPVIIGNNDGVRWDYRMFAGRDVEKNTPERLSIHERLENEPAYHTSTEIEIEAEKPQPQVQPAPKKTLDGRTLGGVINQATGGAVKVPSTDYASSSTSAKKTNKEKIILNQFSANSDTIKKMIEIMKTNVPIVPMDFAAIRFLSSDDLGYGAGEYYDCAGIKDFQDKNDFEECLATMGVNLKEVRKKNIKDVEFVTKSKVTGHLRKIFIVDGTGFKTSAISPTVMWTEDPNKNQTKIANDVFRNVREWEAAAIELIGWKPEGNGLPLYGLFDFQGQRQNAAPSGVVADYKIPLGNSMDLQGAVSCIRCHCEGKDGEVDENGIKNIQPDFSLVIAGRIDLLNDVRKAKENRFDVIDEISAQLGNNIAKPIRRAREDFSESAFKASGGVKLHDLAAHMQKVFERYIYTQVDAQAAMQALGYSVNKKEAAAKFAELVGDPGETNEDIPEDIIVAMLKQDRPVHRWQFNLVYADLIQRAMAYDGGEMPMPAKKVPKRKEKEPPVEKVSPAKM